MGDKLNTAEYDKKGRCVRHPAIRLRKKKIFGGWKIIIGHCPECCLDEMRRVRDEIAEQDHHSGGGSRDDGDQRRESGSGRRKEKKKKKSSRHGKGDDRGERRSNKHRLTSADSISEVGSEGQNRSFEGPHNGHGGGGGGGHHPQGDLSEATGSTAPTSMDGTGSVVSEQYIPRHHSGFHGHGGGGGGGGRDNYYQPPHPHHQQPPPQQHHQHPASPPPAQRTMVLSMAFTDPQTGQRGTYTGQVNSINHKPDGKGTVYYSNGSIAEGTWMNGLLMESEDDSQGGGGGGGGTPDTTNYGGGGGRAYSEPPEPNRSRSQSRGTSKHRDPPQGGIAHQQSPRKHSSSRSSSSTRGSRAPPPPPPPPGSNNSPFSGNLDRLDKLGGKGRRLPRGASASVQSYNSRGSAHDAAVRGSSSVSAHGMAHMNMNNGPSGSASVQDYSGGGYHSGGGGVASAGFNEFRRSDSGYNQQQRQLQPPPPQRGSQSFHGQNAPGYR